MPVRHRAGHSSVLYTMPYPARMETRSDFAIQGYRRFGLDCTKAMAMAITRPDKVPLIALVTVLQRIASAYHQRGIESFDLSACDFYRAFATDEMFDVYAQAPSPIGIGALHDDIAELSKLLANSDRMPTSVDLERLGNLLRAVSALI